MAGSGAAILAAIDQLHQDIQANREEFRQELRLVYANLARSDEVQAVKQSLATLAAKLSTMPTEANCAECRKNFVDKRTFLGIVGGLTFAGGMAALFDKIRGWFEAL